MARNRMLNPDFWLDEEVSAVSPHARLLYMGLWGICDDNYATLPDRPDWIRIQIFPYEKVDTQALLNELSLIGKIVRFQHQGKFYWHIRNFFKHQTINRPSKPKYPPFKETLTDSSVSTHTELRKLNKERKGKSSNEDRNANTSMKAIGDKLRERGMVR